MANIDYKEYLNKVRNSPNSPAHYRRMSDQLLESTLARGGMLPEEYGYNSPSNEFVTDVNLAAKSCRLVVAVATVVVP